MSTADRSFAPTASALREGMVSGALRPTAVMEDTFRRIARLEPDLDCFVTLDEAAAYRQAEALEAKLAAGHAPGALFGVPISVKDQLETQGLRSTGGSAIFADHVPVQDAASVARLRAADAIVIGKTTTPEFGMFWRAAGKVAPETRNPYDRTRTSGGSSGGAAASVAAGMTAIAVGTDGGGSIRLPASFCGVFGLHTTHGTIPQDGLMGGARLFSQVGPIAAELDDLALLHSVLAVSGESQRARTPERLRLGWWQYEGPMSTDHDSRIVAYAAARLADHAAGRHDLAMVAADALPIDRYLPAFQCISKSDRYGLHGHAFYDDPAKRALLSPYVQASYADATRYSGADYARAMRSRAEAIEDVKAMFRRFDLIASPTAGTLALPIPPEMESRPPGYFTYTFAANFTGIPAISIPCGFIDELPVGLQVMAPWGCEAKLIDFARAFHAAHGPNRAGVDP